MDGYRHGRVTPLPPNSHATGGWAIPPWLVPMVLDKKGEVLLSPHQGNSEVEGRMAFIDLMADGRGRRDQRRQGGRGLRSRADGLKVPILRSVAGTPTSTKATRSSAVPARSTRTSRSVEA